MPTQETIPGRSPLLLTKLHRPPTTPDMLIRTRLLVGLDQGRQRPLTLISAPAGYGKTVLASSWLETCDFPSAWVSLDEHDNNLVGFLSDWIAAVLGIFPEAELVTEFMLRAPSTPSVLDLAWGLANDMDGIEQPFILVLDDYHHIHEMAVHRLLNEILRHPPRLLHLVIISRGDPPLMLNKLRAQRQMNEIRINALSFTPDETAVFLNDVMDISIDPRAASSMRDKTEGWVTALRMAALSLRHRKDVEGLLGSLQGDSRYLQDYLASEVVSHQPPDIQDWMLKTSILQRFCAPLCEALCRLEGAAAESNLTGPVFISWLQDAGLFVVPLDGQHEWFRYHHLFQQALQRQLMQKIGAEQLARYHSQVSTWLAQNNLIDEALHHALAAGDHLGAAELVETYWYAEAEAARWHIVESWLARLPVEIKRQRPALLLAEAFIALISFPDGACPTVDRAG